MAQSTRFELAEFSELCHGIVSDMTLSAEALRHLFLWGRDITRW